MTKTQRKYRLYKRWLIALLALIALLTVTSNLIVEYYAAKFVHNDLEALPQNKVGLVLGTSKLFVGGSTNLFFKYRIEAAARLYETKKVKFIILSGDNATKNYNEPKDMLEALLKEGVPREKIFLDYAGFRTLDSIIRCKEVFEQNSFTIVSQKFHNERAVFLAHAKGINAVAFNAKDVNKSISLKTRIREYFARVKVFIDLFIAKQPKYLGEPVKIE